MPIRKNITTLNDFAQKIFEEGVKKLKNTSQYNVFIMTHFHILQQVHHTPLFLPWHRAFLLEFEQRMQAVLDNPDFAVPYWDWTADTIYIGNRGEVWSPERMGGAGYPVVDGPYASQTNDWVTIDPIHGTRDPFKHQLCRDLAQQDPLSAYTGTLNNVLIMLQLTTFQDFAMHVELEIHDSMHSWVGGQMRDVPFSVNDPVFWLHHCNLDRIFTQFQLQYGYSIPTFSYTEPDTGKRKLFGPNIKMPPTYDQLGGRTIASVWNLQQHVNYDKYYFAPTAPSQIFVSSDFATPQPVNMLVSPDNSTLFFAIISGDNRPYIASYDGNKWTTPLMLFSSANSWATPRPMTLAYFRNQYYLTIVHSDNRVYYAISSDGINWPAYPTQMFPELDWATPQPVTMISTKDKLFFGLISGDNRPYIASYDGYNWTQPMQLFSSANSWATPQALGLAYFNDQVYLTIVGDNRSVYYAASSDGVNWPAQPTHILGGMQVSQSVNLLATSNELLLTLVQFETNYMFIGSSDGTSFNAPVQFNTTDDWQTPQPITLANFQNNIYLTYMHWNNRIYQSRSALPTPPLIQKHHNAKDDISKSIEAFNQRVKTGFLAKKDTRTKNTLAKEGKGKEKLNEESILLSKL